jgi:hypothetical protein
MESVAANVVQQRMKRAGMRRTNAGSDALLAPRARLRSHRPPLIATAQTASRQHAPIPGPPDHDYSGKSDP